MCVRPETNRLFLTVFWDVSVKTNSDIYKKHGNSVFHFRKLLASGNGRKQEHKKEKLHLYLARWKLQKRD